MCMWVCVRVCVTCGGGTIVSAHGLRGEEVAAASRVAHFFCEEE